MITAFTLSSCLTTKMTPQVKNTLKSISIDNKVKIVDPTIQTRLGAISSGLMQGAYNATTAKIASVATDVALSEDQRAYINIKNSGMIVFDTEFKKVFKKELSYKPFYAKKLNKKNVNATFKLSIVHYGIMYNKLSSGYYPRLIMKAELLDTKGNVLWDNSVSPQNVPSLDFEEFSNNPSKTKKVFHDLIPSLVKELLKTLP